MAAMKTTSILMLSCVLLLAGCAAREDPLWNGLPYGYATTPGNIEKKPPRAIQYNDNGYRISPGEVATYHWINKGKPPHVVDLERAMRRGVANPNVRS